MGGAPIAVEKFRESFFITLSDSIPKLLIAIVLILLQLERRFGYTILTNLSKKTITFAKSDVFSKSV
jgi:hypothetical protein